MLRQRLENGPPLPDLERLDLDLAEGDRVIVPGEAE